MTATTPHDTLFRFVLQSPELARAWVESVLPQAPRQRVDWTTFAPQDASSDGMRLRRHHADLLFAARLANADRSVLFVIEHKSGPDPDLRWQLLRYALQFGHRARRRKSPAGLVVAMALAHGGLATAEGWHQDLGADDVLAFAPLQPRIDVVLDDLAASDEAALRARPLPPRLVLLFLLLQHTRERAVPELLAALHRWADLLRAVESEGQAGHEALDEFGWYLVDTSDLTETDVRMAFDQHLQHPENTRMTTGQKIRMESRRLGREEGLMEGKAAGRAEGKAEGRELGLLEGRRSTLLRLLTRRFGPLPAAALERLAHGEGHAIDLWLDRVLDAPSLDAVFQDR